MKTKRNSVLEILRLLASLWVMNYHGISLISNTDLFSNGRIAVDFFFVLSGFFFLNGVLKEIKTNNLFKDTAKFVWKRFKPLMFTFCFCMIFSLIYFIANYKGFLIDDLWGYLWYVPHLMLVFAVYYILNRAIKNKKIFNIITFVIVLICYTLILTNVTNFGLYRGFAGVGMGILISQIPTLKNENTKKVIPSVMFALIFISIISLVMFCPIAIQDPLCLIILFPALIYFANQINFSNYYINKICSISFGLYCYQTVTRVLVNFNWVTNKCQLFFIVVLLAILDRFLVKFVYKKKSI